MLLDTRGFIRKMQETLKLIRSYVSIDESGINEAKIDSDIVRNIFLNDLGFDTLRIMPQVYDKANKKIDLLVRVDDTRSLIVEVKRDGLPLGDKEFAQTREYLVTQNQKWAILTNGVDFVLINSETRLPDNPMKGDIFSRSQAVLWLNIFDSKNKEYIDHKYVYLFSRESLFGTQNTLFFRDIMSFKSILFPDGGHSWHTYKSTLFSFFSFYIENKSKKYRENILKEVTIDDFKDYVNYKQRTGNRNKIITSTASIKNNYSHLSSMLSTLRMGTNFDRGRDESLEDFISKENTKAPNHLSKDTIIQAASCFYKNSRSIDKVTIFLMLCLYGVERQKIPTLLWSCVKQEERCLSIEGRQLHMPQLLCECLLKLKEEKVNKKCRNPYIFAVQHKGKWKPISVTSISTFFNQLSQIDENQDMWELFTPQYIRNCLISNLFDEGYSIEEIIYITGIDISNIPKYISTERIIKKVAQNLRGKRLKAHQFLPQDSLFGGAFDMTLKQLT